MNPRFLFRPKLYFSTLLSFLLIIQPTLANSKNSEFISLTAGSSVMENFQSMVRKTIAAMPYGDKIHINFSGIKIDSIDANSDDGNTVQFRPIYSDQLIVGYESNEGQILFEEDILQSRAELENVWSSFDREHFEGLNFIQKQLYLNQRTKDSKPVMERNMERLFQKFQNSNLLIAETFSSPSSFPQINFASSHSNSPVGAACYAIAIWASLVYIVELVLSLSVISLITQAPLVMLAFGTIPGLLSLAGLAAILVWVNVRRCGNSQSTTTAFKPNPIAQMSLTEI